MKKDFKRIVTLLAVTILLTSVVMLTGCGGQNAVPEQSTKQNGSAGETEGTTEGPPVELSITTPPCAKNFPAGYQEDPVIKQMEQKLNVHLNVTPYNAVGDAVSKFTAQLASNDFNDIVYIPYELDYMNKICPQIISAKAALPMDDYIGKYGQDIVQNAPQVIESNKKYFSRDVNGNSSNKLYFLALNPQYTENPVDIDIAPRLRFDLYQKLGAPKLETMDDYIPVLKQMMALEPKNSQGQKNWGVSGWFAEGGSWGAWPMQAVWPMMEGIGGIGPFDIAIRDGSSKSMWLDKTSVEWQAIEWFNKAYRAGVLDSDAFVMKWADYQQKGALKTFLAWADWNISAGNDAFTKAGTPEKGFVTMPSPQQANEAQIFSYPQMDGSFKMMISSNCKNPEKAVQLLNYLFSFEGSSLIYNGAKDASWTEVDGKPAISQEILDQMKNDPDYSIKTGTGKYSNMAGLGMAQIDKRYNVPLYYQYLPEVAEKTFTQRQKTALAFFKVNNFKELYSQKKLTAYNASAPNALPPDTDDIKAIGTKRDTYLYPQIYKLILSKTEEDFKAGQDKTIEELKKIGQEKVEAYYKALPSFKEVVNNYISVSK